MEKDKLIAGIEFSEIAKVAERISSVADWAIPYVTAADELAKTVERLNGIAETIGRVSFPTNWAIPYVSITDEMTKRVEQHIVAAAQINFPTNWAIPYVSVTAEMAKRVEQHIVAVAQVNFPTNWAIPYVSVTAEMAQVVEQQLAAVAQVNFPTSWVMPNVTVANAMAKVVEQFNSATSYLNYLPSFSVDIRLWNIVQPDFKRLKESLRHRLLLLFEQIGLWPAPSMSYDFMLELVGFIEYGKEGQVEPFVWDYYAENNHERLKKTVSIWWDNPEFMARRNQIEDALDAHLRNRFSSPVTILAPYIEGIAGHFFRSRPIEKFYKDGKQICLGDTKAVVLAVIEFVETFGYWNSDELDPMYWVMNKSLRQYIKNVFYKRIIFSKQYTEARNPGILNRHTISHGIQTSYPTKMDSLRCFLLLDALYSLLKSYSTGVLVL